MFEISRDTILTTERHAKFLHRRACALMVDNYIGRERRSTIVDMVLKYVRKAHAWVANPENKALGLAANQVGSKFDWFVMNYVDGSTRVIFQPIIIGRSGNKKHDEGCFSEPECDERIKRSREITVQFTEYDVVNDTLSMKQENMEGRDAQVFQHEYDHLRGKLLSDKKQQKVTKKGWF